MTIEEIKQLFPEETENKTDKQLQQYCFLAEILAEMFLNKFKDGVDNGRQKNAN